MRVKPLTRRRRTRSVVVLFHHRRLEFPALLRSLLRQPLASRGPAMYRLSMPNLPEPLKKILSESFYLRTTLHRRDGSLRVIETTYYWDGADHIVLSGYPGKRDWVASISRNPEISVHTVEFEPRYDIAATARVLRDRDERLPYLINFIENWALRPGFPRKKFQFLLGAVKLNRKMRLPWWGPFILARRIFDQMPCVLVTLTGEPVERPGLPPALSEQQDRPF